MKMSWKIYLSLTVVFILSVVITFMLPVNDFYKGIIATPAMGSLFYALYQISRDESAFKKEKYLQQQKQFFNLGSTSHMANVVFNKHVEFIERYMEEVHKTVSKLFREGPTKEAIELSNNLFRIREQYAAWIPKEESLKLEPFENAVREIGSLSYQADIVDKKTLRGSKTIIKLYDKFSKVLGIDLRIDEQEEEIYSSAVEEVKSKIGSILGIEELTAMRKMLIKEAISFLKKET